jgi:MoxR-like ATPase
MTARQPGEGRQGAKVSPETGTMWRTTAQPTAAFLDLPSAPHAHGGTSLGKTSVRATPDSAAEPAESRILERLGIVGMGAVEPVILAALIQQDPLLLIGPHGTGKSYLLNRLAASLRLQHRHYNASLLNFDDLVGYPLPNGSGGLDYIQTPASIWGAQSVFIDEISRCRPEVQNKLFSIIHERCVQGLPLRDLVYRWSAMNPPAADDGDSPYAGSEPLDQALADRFAFILGIPDWQRLGQDAQERLILTADSPLESSSVARYRQRSKPAGAWRPRSATRFPGFWHVTCGSSALSSGRPTWF